MFRGDVRLLNCGCLAGETFLAGDADLLSFVLPARDEVGVPARPPDLLLPAVCSPKSNFDSSTLCSCCTSISYKIQLQLIAIDYNHRH